LLKRFVRLWRRKAGLLAVLRQGLNSPSINQTDLITMDPVGTIYPPYRFSFTEEGQRWTFDLRALLMLRQTSSLQNPYTRSPLSEETLARLYRQVHWLTDRRYALTYPLEGKPTPQQTITGLCLLMDSYGYWIHVEWFSTMTIDTIHDFINCLDGLWMEELGLTDAVRQVVYPEWTPAQMYLVPAMRRQRLVPLLGELIAFLTKFLTAAEDREMRSLACVYVLKALASISPRVRASYPWLLS